MKSIKEMNDIFKKNSLDNHKRKIDKEMNVKVKDVNKILKEKKKMNNGIFFLVNFLHRFKKLFERFM